MKMINIILMTLSYECAFHFEAMLKKIEIKDNEKEIQIISEHVPVSVSIFSNVLECVFPNLIIYMLNY